MANPLESPVEPQEDCQSCPVRSAALFGEISPELVERVQSATQPLAHPAGEVLFEAGQRADAAFTLREGTVKLVRSQPGNRSQIVRLLVGGDLLGAEGLFGEPYQHTAIALTPVRLCRLPMALLELLRTEDPRFTDALLGRWRRALSEVETLAVELGTCKAEERLAAFFLHWQRKHDKHGDSVDWLPLPLSRTELGELLGLRVETVSRLMARWKREGLLKEAGGKIQLLDTATLHGTATDEGLCT
ncbi:hypothetical protein CKO13_08615 [Halorhodospira neutriphila]|uniref:Transcriptional regulator, Crp/Fnr family n=1 Tax=Halorhodospira neutriphila TaxID=168379 RepID=A0ABS1E7B5_9GAMM|nr:Crp/Fnr family transcriptional regulator [Halorhodospira neutriphila]MBK1727082.1 hypothetical protein [Halorhodospira neutriphila]